MNMAENEGEVAGTEKEVKSEVAEEGKLEQENVGGGSTENPEASNDPEEQKADNTDGDENAANETDDEDAASIEEWRKSTGSGATGSESKPEKEETTASSSETETLLAKENSELKLKIGALEEENAGLKSFTETPLVKAWIAHMNAKGDEATPKSFLTEISMIREINPRSEEQMLEELFTKKARALKVPEDLLEKAVEEQFQKYGTLGILDQAQLLAEAKADLNKGSAETIEEISKKYEEEVAATRREVGNWSRLQLDNLTSFTSFIAKKGRYSGRDIDPVKWKEEIIHLAGTTNDFMNPAFGNYQEDGNLDPVKVVEFLDWIANRDKIREFQKTQVQKKAKENLSQRKEQAHNTAIVVELKGNKSEDQKIKDIKNANRAAQGLPPLP